MNLDEASQGPEDFNDQVRAIWDRNAAWWDNRMGEGNDFQRVLIAPATERLLDLKPEERVLDVACGNGLFSRRMAQLGARVTAFDFSEVFLRCARDRTTEHADRIEYKLIDATDQEQLLALGRQSYDAAVCSMALMDMAQIDTLISALAQLLRRGGRFVFSVMHPCFNNPAGCKMVGEEQDQEGVMVRSYAIQVMRYIRASTAKGLGIVGQPTPQYYFHRPISVLFQACFRHGLVLDGLEEPTFGEDAEGTRPFGWQNYLEIPPVLVAKMRLP